MYHIFTVFVIYLAKAKNSLCLRKHNIKLVAFTDANEVFPHLKSCKHGDECQGHTPSVSPWSLKFGKKLHDISQNCLQCSNTQPRRDYHIARIHLRRAVMHSETQFSTQVHLPAPLYIHLYSERPFRLVHRLFSRLSIYHARFCFLIHHSDPFSISAEARDPPHPPKTAWH